MDLPRKPAFHPRKPVAKLPRVNQLYYGDNLLFKSPKVGSSRCDDRTAQRAVPTNYSEAQITAFEDSWHWGEQAEREFDEVVLERGRV
jgi:hypothetical protein